MKRKVRPNVVSGGTAINLGNNLYYMRGKTHKQGGIDIGSNPKTGIEVENGEVVQTSPKGLRVFSAQPILNGISPANALLMGGQPNKIFNAQEAWKKANHYNDDGSKFGFGGPDKDISKDKWFKWYNEAKKPRTSSTPENSLPLSFRLIDDDIEKGDYDLYTNDNDVYDFYKSSDGKHIYKTFKYGEYTPNPFEFTKISYDDIRKMLPKRDYIGGKDYRLKTVERVPGLKDYIYNKAKEYSINPNLLLHRFMKEGIVDNWVNRYNQSKTSDQKTFFNNLTNQEIDGFLLLGLDDSGSNLDSGLYKLNRKINYNTIDHYNEKTELKKSAVFDSLWDAIEVKAADMAYRQAELKKRGIVGDQFVNAAYNMGLNHKNLNDADYVNRNYSVPQYYAFGGETYKPSQEIIDYIKKTEGFRDKWYKDGNGIDTIGYGFTGSRIKKLYPNGITREQADKEFADSIAKRALILAKDTPNWDKLSQSQRDALLSYHYNVGEGSYRNNHPKLQQALTDSDWEAVMLNMDAGYNDKNNPGLRTRRDYERELFKSGMIASLTGDEEKAFRDWYDRYARSQNLDLNPDAKEHYYDYRTYWKNRTPEQMNDEWKLGNHLPDTYKKPGHPTFSTESIYSTRRTPGGTWKKVGLGPVYDEQFVDSKYTKNLKKYQNVSFALGGDNLKQNGYIEPSVITVPLPKKFKGSQAAARRYAEGYQFGKQIAKERDKTAPYILAAANAPMLIEGLAVAPLATLASIAGGHIGGEIGYKVGGDLGGVIGGFVGGGIGGGLGAGARAGIRAGIKPVIKYGNGVLDRTAEAFIRLGDHAHSLNKVGTQFLNKNTLKYIFNPKAKNLAYKMPYKYSGQSLDYTDAFPGDIVDQFLGKTEVPNATYDLSILPKGMRDYIYKYYPNKKIPIRNLGKVAKRHFMIDIDDELMKQFKAGKTINTGGEGIISDLYDNKLLDAGGFNAVIERTEPVNNYGFTQANVKGTDIWKFNPKDYSKRYNFDVTDLMKRLGLKFIDSRGTPIVHTFESEYPIRTGRIIEKYGGIHIKPSKRGTFTAAAKRHNMSVQEFARTVLNNRARYSAAMVKKANFARNASKWHKKELGGDMTKQYYITKDNIYSFGGSPKRKAPLGTKYTVDENGIIVPINIPNTDINIGEIHRLLDPVTVTNIVNPITSPRDSALNKPDFNSTVLAAFPNPDYNPGIGAIKEKSSTGNTPKNPYYSTLNVGLHRAGNYIRNNPDLLGLGINLTGNLAASLINRSAIKGMRYVDAPIPISAQKLPTEVNIEPQLSSIRENIAGQEKLIADNTADSRVALARRQRVRNQGTQQYQTLFGNKLNTELQLLTADRLNRQGVDAQNVTQYNQWRRGLYDFENRRREMLAENSVAGINNAAEAIAGERGYLARKEARRQNLLNMGLIAATSPNAQNVIGSKEFEEFLRKIGYDGNFSLLRKRING